MRRQQTSIFLRNNLNIAAANPGLGHTCGHPIDYGVHTALTSGNLKTDTVGSTTISGAAATA